MSGSVLHRFIADLTAAHVIRSLGHLPVAGYLARHPEALRAGSYEGSDLQNMPLAICRDCGHAAGLEYLGGTVPRCACGGAWRPYVFQVDGEVWDHVRVAKRFYGLTHVVFANDAAHGRSNRTWEQMQWIVANVLRDAERGSYAGPCTAPRPQHVGGAVAFAAGWLSHIVSDSWMKDAVPNACAVQLPDGKYTPTSRLVAEYVVLTSFGHDLGSSYERLLFSTGDWDDNGIYLHYLMTHGPEHYAHWRQVADWRPDPAQHRVLHATITRHRSYFQATPLTSQFIAGQILDGVPPGKRLGFENLLDYRCAGRDHPAIMDLVFASGLVGFLRQVVEEIGRILAFAQQELPLVGRGPPAGPVFDYPAWMAALTTAAPVGRDRAHAIFSEPGAQAVLRQLLAGGPDGRIIAPTSDRPYLARLVARAQELTGWPLVAAETGAADDAPAILIGGPGFNPLTAAVFPFARYLELKYGQRHEAAILVREQRVHLVGFSDYGDALLAEHLLASRPS